MYVPVLPTVLRVLRKPAGHTPGGVGLKCRVVACSIPVPARSMHGQPLTGRLPVSQILVFQVSGRARRKLTKRRKFPRLGPDEGARRLEGAVPQASVHHAYCAVLCCAPSTAPVVCVRVPLGSRDIAPRFWRTRLRAARLSQWATLIS